MAQLKYKVIVGLEIHVQLCTKSKMFCGCAVEFGAEPNSRVCPVCLGMPGVLPVMNMQAFEYAVLVGLALDCRIPMFTKWDRKSYYYPDLPKNYQISQYDLPLAANGFLEIPIESGGSKKIGIIRAHLEEDAGKNLHTAGNFSQVDLNRTGTPLLEIVTEPDMNGSAEVRALATELQRIVRFLGVSEADMQKGHMRFEPNINLIVTKDAAEYRTPIVEIKNLNSFRALERSVNYEIRRQLDEFLETGQVMEMGNKTTRGWDDEQEVSVLQREKGRGPRLPVFPRARPHAGGADARVAGADSRASVRAAVAKTDAVRRAVQAQRLRCGRPDRRTLDVRLFRGGDQRRWRAKAGLQPPDAGRPENSQRKRLHN
jgi:aspartyl-tRNA(Asn)/glutamyl-tRNA(Gln) amidotransferase subunit B